MYKIIAAHAVNPNSILDGSELSMCITDDEGLKLGLLPTFVSPQNIRYGAAGDSVGILVVNAEQLTLIEAMPSLTVLAVVNQGEDLLAAMTSANRALYDGVYDQSPQDVFDEDSVTVIGTITPPALFVDMGG